MKTELIDLNAENFHREVLLAGDPVVVHFWATWSKPCQSMTWFGSLAETSPFPLKMARVNVESEEILTEECGVTSVPTVLIYQDGILRHKIQGRTTEPELRATLERLESGVLIPDSAA